VNKSKSIRPGDYVTLVWADGTKNHHFLVVNRPRGEGDMWEFEIDEIIIAINIYTPRFEYMVKEP